MPDDAVVRWIGVRALLEPRPGGQFRFELHGDGCDHLRARLATAAEQP